MKTVTHPFEPLYDKGSRILILGSFPSVKSRENKFFYGHPQNRFWKIISNIYGEQVPETVDDKKRLILNNNLALWDVIAQCEIEGSSDASIKNVKPNDIASVLENSSIQRIIVNGKTAEKLYIRHVEAKTKIKAEVLPSTSPANAVWSLDRLIEIWGKALECEI